MKEITVVTVDGGMGGYIAADCIIDTSEGTVTIPSDDRKTTVTYNWSRVTFVKTEEVSPEDEAELREHGYLL